MHLKYISKIKKLPTFFHLLTLLYQKKYFLKKHNGLSLQNKRPFCKLRKGLIMDYKKNLKYFKSNDKHFYIGAAIMAIGIICFALYYFFWILFLPYHEITSALLIVAGAITAFAPLSFRSSGKDIDEMLLRSTQNYALNTAEKAGLEQHLHPNIKPTTVGNFIYDGENVLLRRGRTDSKLRSSIYAATAMIFTCKGIYVVQKRFSLIEKVLTESEAEFVYADIDSVQVETQELSFEKLGRAKASFIVIKVGGKEAMRIPASNAFACERLCEDINYTIKNTKNEK